MYSEINKYFQFKSPEAINSDGVSSLHQNNSLRIYFADSLLFRNFLPQLASLLSESETNRYKRFHREVDRAAYIVSHAFLYLLLAEKLGVPPQELEFIAHENQKPRLNGLSIDFNISHSAHYIALVIGLDPMHQVGVDIEGFARTPDIDSISASYFHASEISYIKNSSIDQQNPLYRFTEIWTRKEAFLKMIGQGLAESLPDVDTLAGNPLIDTRLNLKMHYKTFSAYVCSTCLNNFYLSVASSLDVPVFFQEVIPR